MTTWLRLAVWILRADSERGEAWRAALAMAAFVIAAALAFGGCERPCPPCDVTCSIIEPDDPPADELRELPAPHPVAI